MTNCEYGFLTPHRIKDPFDNPACKNTETNYFEYLWHCFEGRHTLRVDRAWVALNNRLLPTRCSIVKKVPGYGIETGLVVNSPDSRLVGFVVCASLAKPRKHFFTRPKRPLYNQAIYYPPVDPDLVSEQGLALLSNLGLTQAIIHLLTLLQINTNPHIQTNINQFSEWVDLRPQYVRESWPRFQHNYFPCLTTT